MNNLDRKRRYYPFIDGLRAVAIMGVLIAHLNGYFMLRYRVGLVYEVLSLLGPVGHLGVDVFFVISGFLITGILLDDFKGEINVKRFYIRRFFKIIPHYAVAAFAGFVLYKYFRYRQIFGSYHDDNSELCHIFFYMNYAKMIPTLGHTWSLAIEEHFYLVYPLIAAVIFKFKKDPEVRKILLTASAIVLAFVSLATRHLGLRVDILEMIFTAPDIALTTVYRMDGLIFGCLLKVFEPYYDNKKSYWKFFAPVCCLVAFFIVGYMINTVDPGENINCWDKYLLAYMATGFIFMAAYHGFRPLNALLENKWMRWLGQNSYGIYLWHVVIIYLFIFLIGPLGFAWTIITYVVSAVAIGAVSTATVERYFLKIRRKVAP